MTGAEIFPLLFLPPLEGGSARVPCQIIDLAEWVREGEVAEEKDFLRRITLTLTLSLRGRGEKDVELSLEGRGKICRFRQGRGKKRCRALPSRAREGICGVLPLKAREEKERGIIKGHSPL